MINYKLNKQRKERRHGRVRANVSGTITRPRLSVFRSNKGMYIQLINDEEGKTLVSASVKEIKKKGTKVELAKELGLLIAEKAKKAKVTEVVFDRGSYQYHGRVKAVADGAREGGLKF